MLYSEQIRSARALINWNQQALAKHAGLGIMTVKRIESRPGPVHANSESVWKLQAALEKAGIIFISSDNQGGPGVRLAHPAKASSRRR
jgi:transcriptional regulator with XRE-family HTH domain